jgi:hypothetical protein
MIEVYKALITALLPSPLVGQSLRVQIRCLSNKIPTVLPERVFTNALYGFTVMSQFACILSPEYSGSSEVLPDKEFRSGLPLGPGPYLHPAFSIFFCLVGGRRVEGQYFFSCFSRLSLHGCALRCDALVPSSFINSPPCLVKRLKKRGHGVWSLRGQ